MSCKTDTQIRVQKTAHCPSCDTTTQFRFLGEQHWPEKVAKAANMPMVVDVWGCTTCQTTLLGPTLDFE